MDGLILTSGSTAVISAIVLQFLKNRNWVTFLGKEPQFQNANLIVSILIAGLTSIGITYGYNSTTGDATIVLSTHQLWRAGLQWVAQHAAYKTAIVPTELLAGILNQLKAQAK